MNLEVGGTYELYVRGATFPLDTVVVHVIAECMTQKSWSRFGETRLYTDEPGYRLLVLSASGYHGDVQPGVVYEWTRSTPILGRSIRLA